MKQLRQGDVFLQKIDSIPDEVDLVPKECGKVILAHGEATGHAHSIGSSAKLFQDKSGKRFLKVSRTTMLEHQEHSTITISPGCYEVVRQREYSPEEIRQVAD